MSVRVAVNVSARQFGQLKFVDNVATALEETCLDPARLEIELTESVMIRNFSDFSDSTRKFEQLRELGIAISIDDFGTGYSSLSYLETLPVDSLKIDASFTRRIAPGQPPPALVQAIIGLAHNLRKNVIAEGIESEYQIEVLRELGCDQGQGYWIGKPVTGESACRILFESGYFRIPARSVAADLISANRHLVGRRGDDRAAGLESVPGVICLSHTL